MKMKKVKYLEERSVLDDFSLLSPAGFAPPPIDGGPPIGPDPDPVPGPVPPPAPGTVALNGLPPIPIPIPIA